MVWENVCVDHGSGDSKLITPLQHRFDDLVQWRMYAPTLTETYQTLRNIYHSNEPTMTMYP